MTIATKRQYYVVAAIFFLGFSGLLQLNSFTTKGSNPGLTDSPRNAAVSQKNVFPTQGATLDANTSYSFTTALRDDAAWNRVFDGGNLTIKKSGVIDSTQHLLETGSFNNCSFSFQNDITGTIPNEWTGNAPGTTSIGVVDTVDGHQKIVQLTDNDGTVNCSLTKSFSSHQSGTIELWVRKTVTNQESSIMVGDSALFVAMLSNGTWGYIDAVDSRFSLNGTYKANTWYHVAVDFENSTGAYKGLGQARYNVRIDGITLVSNQTFRDGSKWIDRLTIATTQAATGISMQVDAVDYSWSSNYAGNQSAIDESHMGFYNATDSFEEDSPYTIPTGWNWYPGWSGATCQVLPGVGGHRKITCFTGSSIDTVSNLAYAVFGTHPYGTVEAWVRNNNTLRGFGFNLGSGGNLFFKQGGFGYWGYFDPGTWNWHSTGVTYAADTWYHVRIEFECTTGGYKGLGQYQWNAYVNGVKIVSAAGFRVNINSMDNFMFEVTSDPVSPGYNQLDIDAVDFSWDPEYSLERSSYMLVQQPLSIPHSGSYSFLFTLNSSGVGYSGAWTDFQVKAETRDHPGPDFSFIIIIIIIGSVAAVAVSSGFTIRWKNKKTRAKESSDLGANQESNEDKLFLVSTRIVRIMLYQVTPLKLNATQEFKHLENPSVLHQQIRRTVLIKSNQIIPCENERLEIQNAILYITCKIYSRLNFALIFVSTDAIDRVFFPILDSAVDLQIQKDHESINHSDIFLKYLIEMLHLERSFDYNIAVPTKMNVLQSSTLWKSKPIPPRQQEEVEEDLKSMTTSDTRASANYIDSLKESFKPDDNE